MPNYLVSRQYRALSRLHLWLGFACAVALVSTLTALRVSAQGERVRVFEETGHSVRDPYLAFFEQHGDLAFFGYPLTVPFPEGDLEVQCFQRACLEQHPGGHIVLRPLGETLGYAKPPIPPEEIPPPDHPEKFYFAETGHTASFAFLRFLEENGGVDVLGYPISEWEFEPNGRIVQYLQRGKLEWYPENAPGRRVQMGMLGTIYVDQHVDPAYTDPTLGPAAGPRVDPAPPPPPLGTEVTELHARATLEHPILGVGGEQVAYVYVLSGDERGVPGASVEIEIQYGDGRTEHLVLDPTNAHGYSSIAFPLSAPTPGYVIVLELTARYGDLQAQTSTVFLPWW